MSEHFGSMALPVGEFLAKEHGTEFWGVDRRASIDSVEASAPFLLFYPGPFVTPRSAHV